MPRKRYLNRFKKTQESESDEWTHIPGVDGEDTNIEIADTLDVQDRKIYIRDKESKPITVTDIVQEELKRTGQKTRNANQYLKYVNALIDNRLSKLDQIKKSKRSFDDAIEALQPENLKNFERLSKLPIEDLKSKDVIRLLKALKQEKSFTITTLEHFKEKVRLTDTKLKEQGEKIQQIDKKLQEKIVREKKESEMRLVDIIQEELKTLGEIYGMEKLSEAIKKIQEGADADGS